MMYSKGSQQGFTLIELMLAMALFATIMIITTAGFIGINRTYTRGTIKKQLSESVQRLESHLTATLRANQQTNTDSCSGANGSSDCVGTVGYDALCLTGGRYYWGTQTNNSGLYVDYNDCTDTVNTNNAIGLVDERYVVEYLRVEPLPNSGLYRISGGIRTADDAAFTTNLGDFVGLDPADNYDRESVSCRGSSAGSIVQTCAVEHFSTVVNTRGAAL